MQIAFEDALARSFVDFCAAGGEVGGTGEIGEVEAGQIGYICTGGIKEGVRGS